MAFGKKVRNVKALEKSLKRGSSTFIKYIPKDDSILVRFLTEPTEWRSYREVFDPVANMPYPVPDQGMVGSETDGLRVSERLLANVLDVEADAVVPIKLPRSLVTNLLTYYGRKGTMLDRDYELISSGSGLDTSYSAAPEAPVKRNLKKFRSKMHDLEAALEGAYKNWLQASEDTSSSGKKKSGKSSVASSKSKKVVKKRVPRTVVKRSPKSTVRKRVRK